MLLAGRFMLTGHDSVVRTTPQFTLVANRGDTWAAVEGIRLRDGEAPAAVDEVRAFLEETDTQMASWWLTRRTTPADAEAQLLAAGLVRHDDDCLFDGMLTTAPPPPGVPPVEAPTPPGLVAVP